MGKYFETRQQECFGVALANYVMRYGGVFGEPLPTPEALLRDYWTQPFVQSDGATDAIFVPAITRNLTGGSYDAKVTLTKLDHEALVERYGDGIGVLMADEERRGNLRVVENLRSLAVPCIALLENSIDIVGSDEKYYFNAHAVLALGHHWYVDYGRWIRSEEAKVIGAVHLSLQKNPLREACESRGVKYEMPEPLIWEIQ